MTTAYGSNASAAPRPPEQRRRDRRNYGLALGACLLGTGFGHLIRRSGWGGDFGSIFEILSVALGIFCGGAFLAAWRR